MNDERHLFFEALDRDDPADRASYLREACAGDPELHDRISALLRSHHEAGLFLTTPATEQLTAGLRDDLLAMPGLFAPPGRPDSLGRLGAYEVLEVVGRGGMGIVLRAFDESLRRVVAIKILAPEAATRSARERFLREARAAAAIHHDHVMSIFAIDDQGPVPFLVMPFIHGPTLQQRVDTAGPLPPEEVVRIGLQAAEGLAAAHRRGLVHRDIKPANLLIDDATGRVIISDFGLARAVDDPSVTQAGVIAGTPAYMSPEQAEGQHVDHRSDLFSLGSILYFACTGVSPFGSNSTVSALRRVCDHRPTPLAKLNPAVPPWLANLIDRLHEKDPALRPSSAEEVAALLRAGDTNTTPPARSRSWYFPLQVAVCAGAMLAVSLGAAEATGVTNLKATIIRLLIPDGTLVVEVDDPKVSVSIEGTDLVITGTGAREIRLRPGDYRVVATRDGTQVRRELVKVERDGRQVVRVSKEAPVAEGLRRTDEDAAWEASVARMPPDDQAKAVAARLKDLNPGFDGVVEHKVANGKVVELKFCSDEVTDLRPLRPLRALRVLNVPGSTYYRGRLSDLGPLQGLALTILDVHYTNVSDLSPLAGMPLSMLDCGWCPVREISPLKGMKLRSLALQGSSVTDLKPLQDMPLIFLDLFEARQIADLEPIVELPLEYLNIGMTRVSDLLLVARLRSLNKLILDRNRVTDLAPLTGKDTLKVLSFVDLPIHDLSPLRSLKLKALRLTYLPERDAFLRSLTGLELLNEQPVAEFWAKHPAP